MAENNYHLTVTKDGVPEYVGDIFGEDIVTPTLVGGLMKSVDVLVRESNHPINEVNVYVSPKSAREVGELAVVTAEKLLEAVPEGEGYGVNFFDVRGDISAFSLAKSSHWKINESSKYVMGEDVYAVINGKRVAANLPPEIPLVMGVGQAFLEIKNLLFEEKGYSPRYAVVELKNSRNRAYLIDVSGEGITVYSAVRA